MTAPLRCAIYTRKSSEEGLEQPFNSLDNQREACAAYIKSQAGEGWRALSARYDDGGFSGGTTERPALQRLLADIERGMIDLVLVYKIDRLTRSLLDFAKIVERFDRHGISFMSVTQSFNTANSMGRLTLHILLTFAQFERELLTERIKDKIAASRARGIYMGGSVPMGYAVKDHGLVVVPSEAKLVRLFFERYLALGTIRRLCDEFNERKIKTVARDNRRTVKKWTPQRVTWLLTNRTYLGDAVHRDKHYPGKHEPIIERALFDEVAAQLKKSVQRWRHSRTIGSSALLTGLIFDDRGNCMSPHTQNDRSTYVTEAKRKKSQPPSVKRVSATTLDPLVIRCVNAMAHCDDRISTGKSETDRERVRKILKAVYVSSDGVRLELHRCAGDARSGARHDALRRIIPSAQVVTIPTGIQVSIPVDLGPPAYPWRIEGWDSRGAAVLTAPHPVTALLTAFSRAHRWRTMMDRGNVRDLETLAVREKMKIGDVRQTLRLAFLAPDIQKAIIEGRPPAMLSAWPLLVRELPLDWNEQRAVLGVY